MIVLAITVPTDVPLLLTSTWLLIMLRMRAPLGSVAAECFVSDVVLCVACTCDTNLFGTPAAVVLCSPQHF